MFLFDATHAGYPDDAAQAAQCCVWFLVYSDNGSMLGQFCQQQALWLSNLALQLAAVRWISVTSSSFLLQGHNTGYTVPFAVTAGAHCMPAGHPLQLCAPGCRVRLARATCYD